MRMVFPDGERASPNGMTLSGDDDGLASWMDWGPWPILAYPWRMPSLRDTFSRDALPRSMLVEGWPLDLPLERDHVGGGWRSS